VPPCASTFFLGIWLNAASRIPGIALAQTVCAVSVCLALGNTPHAQGQEVGGAADHRYITTNTYHQRQLLTSVKEGDVDGDGAGDERFTIVNTYDRRNHLLAQKVAYDWTPSDGAPDAISTTTKTYDQHGNVLTQVAGNDVNADGTPESTTTTNTYTHRGTR
jgi:hypothetical protein